MQLNLKEILSHLTNVESDIKSALSLIEGDWKTYQNNKSDKVTNWIYGVKDYDSFLLRFNNEKETDSSFGSNKNTQNTAIRRWVNFSCAMASEWMLNQFVFIEPEKDKFHKTIDLRIHGTEFDHKSTIVPRSFLTANNIESAASVLHDPSFYLKDLGEWYFLNQSKEGRYAINNRIFFVYKNIEQKTRLVDTFIHLRHYFYKQKLHIKENLKNIVNDYSFNDKKCKGIIIPFDFSQNIKENNGNYKGEFLSSYCSLFEVDKIGFLTVNKKNFILNLEEDIFNVFHYNKDNNFCNFLTTNDVIFVNEIYKNEKIILNINKNNIFAHNEDKITVNYIAYYKDAKIYYIPYYIFLFFIDSLYENTKYFIDDIFTEEKDGETISISMHHSFFIKMIKDTLWYCEKGISRRSIKVH